MKIKQTALATALSILGLNASSASAFENGLLILKMSGGRGWTMSCVFDREDGSSMEKSARGRGRVRELGQCVRSCAIPRRTHRVRAQGAGGAPRWRQAQARALSEGADGAYDSTRAANRAGPCACRRRERGREAGAGQAAAGTTTRAGTARGSEKAAPSKQKSSSRVKRIRPTGPMRTRHLPWPRYPAD